MSTHSPLALLAALGALALAAPAAAQVDTSQWKCEKCPYTKGLEGQVEAGAGYTSDDSPTFGNYTGLDSKGAHLILGGQLAYRGEGGYWADLLADELGLDIRSIDGQAGREGLYSLWLGYQEIPRYFADGAQTPFLGNGGNRLTLPAGFPANATLTSQMTPFLQPVEIGYEARRFELGGQWIGMENWTYRASLRRDVRDGTKPGAGSFFSTASQLAMQVDQTTDQFDVSASYATPTWQATLGYMLSQYRTGSDSLAWANPFAPVVPGATQGELAQAPDNSFQQITGSASYQITPTMRASADIAWGQGRQNESYLPATANTVLLPSVPPLPAGSLDGDVSTFNFNAKLTAEALKDLRLTAIYAHDQRENETGSLAYPQVATDMFLAPTTRRSVSYDLKQDRVKLNADYRAFDTLKLSGGVDWDRRQRSFVEAVTTTETTVWGRAAWQAMEPLSLSLDLAWGDRDASRYGVSIWNSSPQNPLMRKVNLAPRERGNASARADWAINEQFTAGLSGTWTSDDYDETVIGLVESETKNVIADLTVALSERTRIYAFAQAERMDSRQTGSQAFAAVDWTGTVKDRSEAYGLGIKHAAIPDKLDLGADLVFTRARSDTAVATIMNEPPFPTARSSRDTIKLYAGYKLRDNLWLNGTFWHESYDSADWRLDGVTPSTVHDFLAFGNQAPHYSVNVFRVAVRYQF